MICETSSRLCLKSYWILNFLSILQGIIQEIFYSFSILQLKVISFLKYGKDLFWFRKWHELSALICIGGCAIYFYDSNHIYRSIKRWFPFLEDRWYWRFFPLCSVYTVDKAYVGWYCIYSRMYPINPSSCIDIDSISEAGKLYLFFDLIPTFSCVMNESIS